MNNQSLTGRHLHDNPPIQNIPIRTNEGKEIKKSIKEWLLTPFNQCVEEYFKDK